MSDRTKPGLSQVFESEEQLQKSLENNVAIIHRQCQEIEELKHELDAVTTERDMLLCEVSKLKFEMEIADLKRLHDGWYVLTLRRIYYKLLVFKGHIKESNELFIFWIVVLIVKLLFATQRIKKPLSYVTGSGLNCRCTSFD